MSGLAMSNDEIVVRYKQAKNKGNQVQVLAELNDCPIERIIGILVASGEDNRCFNHLRSKLKKQEEKAAKKFEKLREEHQEQLAIQAEAMKAMPPEPVKAAVAEKMQEVLYSKSPAGKQQDFEDIDLIEIGGHLYEDSELIDAFGKKVHALIDRRRELVAEIEDIDVMLTKYAYMISDLREAIDCEGG